MKLSSRMESRTEFHDISEYYSLITSGFGGEYKQVTAGEKQKTMRAPFKIVEYLSYI